MAPAYFITTPIYYVNGSPHIGHAYTTIAADVLAAWQRALGREVRFLTGTDEHGQKVLAAAQARGLDPKTHCDQMVERWKALMERLQIRHDRFLRTTDPDHQAVVQAVLQRLWEQGEIYQDTYTGWYSTAAERFWTEKDLIDGRCPETGQPVQQITETNYFFRMGRRREELLAHLEANPDYVRPASRRNEVLGFLRKDLGDLCISRPKSRMGWGIEIPFDREYVTYVWFDALLNYLTGTGWHPTTPTPGWDSYWPASVQLLGKDILTTHAVYWSTMLLALGLPLPQTLFAHGWWVSADGQKMSKSLGNTIDVDRLIDGFGLDSVRYFLLREIAFGADGNFSYDGFLTRVNSDLANDLGNLAHRGLNMTSRWFPGVPSRGAWGPDEVALEAAGAEALVSFASAMDSLQPHKAIEAALGLATLGNKAVDTQAPWALQKSGQTDRLSAVLRAQLELLYLAATLLLPVMPERCGELLARLGSSAEQARGRLPALLAAAREGTFRFEQLTEGATLRIGDPLFPRHAELPAVIQELFVQPAAEPPPVPANSPPAAERAPAKPAVTFEDFARLDLRVGQILQAAPHPKADRLLVLTVDLGEGKPRTIVAGIRKRFAPETLLGRKVVVVANLAPANLRGVTSEGMILAAGGSEVIDLVAIDAPIGEVVR